MVQGVDYSFARPDLGCLARSGYKFVVRYTASFSSTKVISPGEARAIHAAGMAIVLVQQDGTSDMLNGYSEGVRDAQAAHADARAIGFPDSRPIYFALDRDPSPLSNAQIAACRSYLDGAASVLGRGRIGVYAGYRGIELLCPQSAPWGWQTYAWSGGRISSKAHFRQYRNNIVVCGGAVDLNETYRPDYGQWNPGGTAPPSTGDEFDMATIAQLEAAIRKVRDEDALRERAARMPMIVRLDDRPEWWIWDGLTRRHIKSREDANLCIFLGQASPLNERGEAWPLKGEHAKIVLDAERLGA